MSNTPLMPTRDRPDAGSSALHEERAEPEGVAGFASARVWRWVLAVLAFVVLASALSPALGSGMRGDDSHVAIDLKGHLAYHHQALSANIADTIEAGLDNGRFMPIGVSQGLTYAAMVPERIPYKLGIVVLALIAVGALYLFLARLGLASLPTLLVVAVAFALSLQFRATHDPVLGYSGTAQLTMIILFMGLWTYLRYLQGGSRAWYALALMLATALVLTYEANPPLVLAFACLHLGTDPRRVRTWRAMLPFLGLGAAMTLLSMYARSMATTTPGGYETSLDPFTIAQVAIRQAIAGVPDIYFVSGAGGLLADPTRAELLGAAWRAALVTGLIIAAVLLVRGAKRLPSTVPSGALPAAAVGVVVMACSGLYISLAAQHQQLIGLGGGHLATFASTMGFVLVAVAAWATWGQRLASSRLAVAGLAVLVFGLTFFSQYSNFRVVAMERPGIEQRDLTRAALAKGALDGIRPATTVYVNSRDLGWAFGNLIFYDGTIDYLAYLETDAQRDIRPDAPPPAEPCPRQNPFPISDCAAVTGSVATLAPRASRSGGTVIVTDGLPAGKVATSTPRTISVLAHGASASGAVPPLAGTKRNGTPWSPKSVTWTKKDLDDGWVRWEATMTRRGGPTAWSLTDPKSPVDFTNPATTPGQLVRQFGTKHLLP